MESGEIELFTFQRTSPLPARAPYGVAGFIITGGRLGSYWVAGLNHNRWPGWIGIRTIMLKYKPSLDSIHVLEEEPSIAVQKSDMGLFSRGKFEYEDYFEGLTATPVYISKRGVLFAADCMEIIKNIKDNQIDAVFADPPFNLGKEYGKNTNDSVPDNHYLEWCKNWIKECVRVLKPGGSIFIYNLPKWNILFGAYLYELNLQFRHWIAIEINSTFPIKGRLYPCHYSLIYFSKGKPKVFNSIRTPIQLCRHCGGEIKDYGGYRKDMNPKGVNLKDVWTDIPPVRHWKFKSKNRRANALSTKLLERVIEISTLPGNIVLDPFGGSGTTYAVCEYKKRNWIGIEIDFSEDIIHRLESDEIKPHSNGDYVEYG